MSGEARAAQPAGHPIAVRHRDLVLAPGAPLVVISGLVGRLPIAMLALAVLILLRDTGASYGHAGLIIGVLTVGVAARAPVLGRLIDRRGPSAVLAVVSVGFALALAGLIVTAHAGAPLSLLLVCAAAAGITCPPVTECMRVVWPTLLATPEMRERTYPLDAAIQEIVFIGGTALVGVLTAVGSGTLAVAFAGAAGSAGGLVFASARGSRCYRITTHQHGPMLGPLRVARVRIIVFAFFAIGAMWGSLIVFITALADAGDARSQAGFLLALNAFGSAIGGIWATAHPPRDGAARRLARALTAIAVLIVPLAFLSDTSYAAPLLLLAGLPTAPALGSGYALIAQSSPRSMTAEAFAWMNSATFVGLATASPAAGVVIDAWSIHAAAGLSAAMGAGAALLAWSAARRPHEAYDVIQ